MTPDDVLGVDRRGNRPSRMSEFADSLGFQTYRELHAWSVGDLDRFWTTAWRFLGTRWMQEPECALVGNRMPSSDWFPGGRLNYADMVRRAGENSPTRTAVLERSQTRSPRQMTWDELNDSVARCAAGLRQLGVGRGDRVAAYAPNIVETLVAFLATAQLGAIWSSCAPEFGSRAVVDRLSQFEPSVLIHVDGYRYGDKKIDRTEEIRYVVDSLPTLRHTVSISYLGIGQDDWSRLLSTGAWTSYEPMEYADPIYVLYSSGTTGLPKPIVHSHVGIAIEHMVALELHMDLGEDDRFFWFSTTGWMMWNLLVSGLLVGSAIVLFDGDPSRPDLSALWSVAESTRTSVFGASAGFFMNCRKASIRPARGELRLVGSTGAPLPSEGFDWIDQVLGGMPVNSTSGGTDVCSSFVGWNPMEPVVAGEIMGPLLGRTVEAYDPEGRPRATGIQGELVVTTPMPSMPLGLLGDIDGRRYLDSYFSQFPGVWAQGDWITITEAGGCVISGRSDATLNRGGVRLGTSDFYSVVEDFAEIVDSLVVHIDDGGRDELFLFVVVAEGATLDEGLIDRIRRELRASLSPRHVPDVVLAAPKIPRTLSGKKLEVPVKKILSGRTAESVSSNESLADPTSLAWFVDLATNLRRDPSA
jgi:acetoacetyl-CoA synthetase